MVANANNNGNRPLFSLGIVAVTRGAAQLLSEADLEPFSFLVAHASGNWGSIDTEDKWLNDAAVKEGSGRIMSAYEVADTGKKIWLITESDRSVTTILLPSEY